MNPADKGVRVGNFLIDTIVLSIIILPAYVIISYYIPSILEKNSIEFNILFYSVFFCYYFLSELLFGKTVGKLLTKTVVVSKGGNKPSVLSLIFRTLIRMIPIEGFAFLFGSAGLHDLLSKTIVIKEKSKLPTA